jgi:hypothetical protein
MDHLRPVRESGAVGTPPRRRRPGAFVSSVRIFLVPELIRTKWPVEEMKPRVNAPFGAKVPPGCPSAPAQCVT